MTFGEIRDGSWDPWGGLGRVEDPQGGPRWLGKPSGKSGMGWETIGEV